MLYLRSADCGGGAGEGLRRDGRRWLASQQELLGQAAQGSISASPEPAALSDDVRRASMARTRSRRIRGRRRTRCVSDGGHSDRPSAAAKR